MGPLPHLTLMRMCLILLALLSSSSSARAQTPVDQADALPEWHPDATQLSRIQSRTRKRPTRVRVGDPDFDFRPIRVDSLGVTFLPARSAEATDPAAPSLVRWREVESIETRHSHVLVGIIFGASLGTYLAQAALNRAGSEPGPGILLYLAFPPAGALLGGLGGAMIPRWQKEWPPPEPPKRRLDPKPDDR